MDKLDEQLVQVVVMQRQIPPLAQKMLETLETFINLDTPFRSEERKARVDLVRSSLAKPKVTASEQVRQVLEAYNIEAEYGRKIDTYQFYAHTLLQYCMLREPVLLAQMQ